MEREQQVRGVSPQAGSGHSPKGGAAISVASPAKPSVPNAVWVEHVAKAIYAARPFCMASTATTFGAQLAQSFDWDGAPAYYQTDMRELAKAAMTALFEPGEAVLCLSWREDGGLRVHSPTHPGMVLSHPRPDLVMLDVLPVLAEMGFPASAIEARSDATAKTGAAEGESAGPKDDAQGEQP